MDKIRLVSVDCNPDHYSGEKYDNMRTWAPNGTHYGSEYNYHYVVVEYTGYLIGEPSKVKLIFEIDSAGDEFGNQTFANHTKLICDWCDDSEHRFLIREIHDASC